MAGTGADALYGMDGDDVLDGGVDGANDFLHAGGGRNRLRRDFSLGANYTATAERTSTR